MNKVETYEQFKEEYLKFFDIFYNNVHNYNLEYLTKPYDSLRKQIIHFYHMNNINNKAEELLENELMKDKFNKYLNNILSILEQITISIDKVKDDYGFNDDGLNWFSATTDGLKRCINMLHSKLDYK